VTKAGKFTFPKNARKHEKNACKYAGITAVFSAIADR